MIQRYGGHYESFVTGAKDPAGRLVLHKDFLADRKNLQEISDKYYELLFAVEAKFPGETRHETALRYILERASNSNNCGSEKGTKL